jgi:hypothetical protein
MHTLVSGRTGKSIKMIESSTKTAIYFPPPFAGAFGYVPPNANRRSPEEVFITGENQERINQAKYQLKELVSKIKLYSKDAVVSASKIDNILLDRLEKVRKIMEANGSYVLFPQLGSQRGLVRVQGTDVGNVERTVKEIMALVKCLSPCAVLQLTRLGWAVLQCLLVDHATRPISRSFASRSFG